MQITQNFGENPKTFPLISLNNVWVVDSRLIAQDLGIEHKNLMETIRKYQNKIENNFGKLTFETEAIGKTNQLQKFCYLTEDQAIFIGTLSRNTDEVVDFKLKLVKSFSNVRKEILQLQQNPQHQLLSPEIQQILLRISFLEKDNQKLHEIMKHLVDVSENRAYIPYKEATPLSKHYVYFAFNPDNNLTKIGRSQEPEARVKAFKATSPNITITLVINVSSFKVACALETTLHAIFASKHKSGELFELLDSDFKAIELLKDSLENLI